MKKNLLFLMLTAAGFLGAAEYFVSPSGSDKNPGSKAKPFRTVAFAAKKAAAGDTVTLLPGLYRESVTFSRSGTAKAPITFKGTKDKNGRILSIVEAPGAALKKWVPAAEVGEGVWKTQVSRRPDVILLDGKMITYINARAMARPKSNVKQTLIQEKDITSWFGRNPNRMPGLDMLGASRELRLTHPQLRKRKELLFPQIGNVLSGWKDGYLYIRFANGSTPDKHEISALKGNGFTVTNARHLVFRDLHLRGSKTQFYLTGSRFITIAGCLLMNGTARINVRANCSDILIDNNILTSGFIYTKSYTTHHRVIYITFKYIVGIGSSADVAIIAAGKDITISNNVMADCLIGLRSNCTGLNFFNNVVTGMASIGVVTGSCTVGELHHNLISYCAILMRFHEMRMKRAKRVEYHYSNLYLQQRFSGAESLVHCGSHIVGDDMINFEKGTNKYKKNPPNPVYPGDFYIYHNTFWGGNRIAPSFDASRMMKVFRERQPFYLVNNIIRYSYPLNDSQHVFDNNLLYIFSSMGAAKKLNAAIARQNRVLSLEESKGIWNSGKVNGIPNITLSKDSPAVGTGVDVSRDFSIRGRKIKALPGFKPGYFKGAVPAAGALQPEENMEHFAKLAARLAKARKLLD